MMGTFIKNGAIYTTLYTRKMPRGIINFHALKAKDATRKTR